MRRSQKSRTGGQVTRACTIPFADVRQSCREVAPAFLLEDAMEGHIMGATP